MPLPFNKTLDLKLIAQVKSNPILYNTRHHKYTDYDAREVVWQKIGDALNRPGSVCKSRWINIRDMMKRKLKDRLVNPNNRIYYYKYEEQLAFMTPYYRDTGHSEDLTEYLDDEAACEAQVPAEVFVDSEEVEDVKDFLKKRNDDTSNHATSREFGQNVFQDLNLTDPLDVFLLTIGTTLRKFSPYYLNQAKSKIFQVVQDYELKQIEKEDPGLTKTDGNR